MPRTTTTQQDSKEANGKPRSSGPSLNRVTLVGRCTRDPELSYTSKGTAYARLSIATNDRSEPEFHSIQVWNQAAEFSCKYLQKGRLIYVDGWLHGYIWQAEDGTMHHRVDVVAEALKALTPPPADNHRGVGEGAQ